MESRSEEEWGKALTAEQFRVLRQGGCEYPFSGEHIHSKGHGVYRCVGCAPGLFSSEGKLESECGWPSFSVAAAQDRIVLRLDNHPDYPGVEVLCSGCGGHLGHVFDDSAQPRGQNYCINSVCLEFVADEGRGE